MSVKRYDLVTTYRGHESWDEMGDAEDGTYVRHDDYAELESKLETALRECRSAGITIDNLEAKCAALAAEKETFAVECAAAKIAIAYLKSGRKGFSLNTPATDAFLAEVKTEARKEGAYFVENRMLAAWEAGFIDDTAKNAADIARMILTSTEFMANAPEGDFDRSFSDGVLEDIAEQLRKGVIQ